MTLVHNPATS